MTRFQLNATGRPALAGAATADGGAERIALGRSVLLDGGTYSEVALTFRALADATRIKIVYSLLHQELCTNELAAIAGVSESLVSQHLRVLRELRLVRSRRDGKLVFHTLDDEHIRILLSVAQEHVGDAGRDQGSDAVTALHNDARTTGRRKGARYGA